MQVIAMNMRGLLIFVLLGASIFGVSNDVKAQNYDVLRECVTISPVLDDIHACLDNYLNVMDGNIADVRNYLANFLSGESLAGLNRSQQAFIDYRRQNCLWYLDFSSPRSEAEQIAKNCLASMSRQRLKELQALLSIEDNSNQTVQGFYVYGAERNSFQPCGSDERYWVEGDISNVGRVQQTYLSLSTTDLQVLYVAFVGSIDKELQAPSDHQGIFVLEKIIEMRVPKESDCRLRGAIIDEMSPLVAATNTVLESAPESDTDELEDQEEPQQQLIAYFGAWLVDCTESNNFRACSLEVAFNTQQSDTADLPSKLIISRGKQKESAIEVRIPAREIESPTLIRWNIDGFVFGDIIGSEIRVDELETRQLVKNNGFLRNDLLPMMIQGNDLSLDVLESVDDESGERFTATLKGLTRALAFADDFVRDIN
jgi:uncharacterized protein YecT (DUF1311 family)/invasion protein IalB